MTDIELQVEPEKTRNKNDHSLTSVGPRRYNILDVEPIRAIATPLSINHSIMSLDPSSTEIKVYGGGDIATPLSINHSLMFLDLSYTGIEVYGGGAMAIPLSSE